MSSANSGFRRLLLGLVLSTCIAVATCHHHWVDIWASMPQEVEPHNLPNPPYVSNSHPLSAPLPQ